MYDTINIEKEIQTAQSSERMSENDFLNRVEIGGFVYKNMCSNFRELMMTCGPRVRRNVTYNLLGLRLEKYEGTIYRGRGPERKELSRDIICCERDGRFFEIALMTNYSPNGSAGQMSITEVDEFFEEDITHVPKKDCTFSLVIDEKGHFSCPAFYFQASGFKSKEPSTASAERRFFREAKEPDIGR
jgi:hypothetical protein